MKKIDQAFIHSSYAHENNVESNERLEWIGDSVLALSISRMIFEKAPRLKEGKLTLLRAALVNKYVLDDKAVKLDFHNKLKLGKGSIKENINKHVNVLCDTFEAFIGVLYLEQGGDAAFNFIKLLFDKDLDFLIVNLENITEKNINNVLIGKVTN